MPHYLSPLRFVPKSLMALMSLVSCVNLQPQKSDLGNGRLREPTRYEASANLAPAPTVEVSKGLLTLFPSSELRSYVKESLAHNLDLQITAARLQESGYDLRNAHSAELPSVTGNSSASRSRTTNGNGNSTSSRFDLGLDAQWEVDVWGRIRASVDASARDFLANAADYQAAQESIAAQTMQAYFDLVAAEKLHALSQRRLVSLQNTFELIDRRFARGTGDFGELSLARTDVENTKSQLAQRVDERNQAARSLAVLSGSYPNTERSGKATRWPSLKRNVKAGVPSELLMKRPDIAAAYQRIRASDARVTVAHRDLYPSFVLTASGGRSSSVLKDLANSNFNVWSILGSMSAPLLDGGERRAELGAANARAQQALAVYHQTVLNALREVEDALGSEQQLLAQESATSAALKASRSAEERIQRNYESGTVEILTLLDTQRRSFDTEEALINITAQRYRNRVSLALALGKGL